MFRTDLFAAVVATVVLTAAGCGGSAPPRTPVTAQQLIVKTNAACAKIHAAFEEYTVTTSPSLARAATSLAPFETQIVGGLKKLAPPSSPASLKADWETIVRGLDTLATDTARVGEYAAQNNLPAARPLIVQTNSARVQILTVAKRSGFTSCGVMAQ
jgi:hypothetical protein